MTDEAVAQAALFQLTGVGVVQTDLTTGRFVRANETFCEMVGYGEAELRGVTYLELTHPDDRARDAESFAALQRGERGGGTSLTRVLHKDGRVVWLELHVTVLGEDDDTVNLTVVNDVTGRKRAEEAVRESEREYQTLFAAMDQGFCIIEKVGTAPGEGSDYRYLEANPAFVRHTGMPDPVRRTIRELVPDAEEEIVDLYDRVTRTGRPERFESHVRALDLWIEAEAFPARAAGQLAVLFTDVTDRKRSEAALRDSEERQAFLLKLSDALRPLPDAVEIQAAVTESVMNYFGADRCYYCEIEGDTAIVRRDASREDLPSVVGVYPLSSLPILRAVVDAGAPFVVQDVSSTELVDEALKQLCLQLQIISFLNVPVIKNAQPVGILCVTQRTPRAWTDVDMELVQEAAERTWAAVTRARAEAALRDLNETLEQRVEARTEALRHSEQRFSQAFYANPIPACMTTFGRETFVEVNDALLALTGYAREEVVGRTSRELGMWSSPEDQKKLGEAQRGGRGFHNLDLRLRTKGGEARDILISAAVIRLNDHDGYLKMFYDVTEQRRTQEQMHRAIQEVMSDTGWFSSRVLEQLAHIRTGSAEALVPVELSRREREVLERLAGGMGNDLIAKDLGLSQQTIRNYISAIYDKLGVHSRAEAVIWARERGIVGG